jgi:Translationally controlled tumour protein
MPTFVHLSCQRYRRLPVHALPFLLCPVCSDAKDIEPVLGEDGKETGLVRTKALKQTAGGQKFDVGGGNEFGGAAADEGADDAEETKWDQFWNFPAIENQHNFSSFKEFKDAMFMPLMLAFKKHAISKGLCKDKDEIKEKGQRMAGSALKWIQTNFKDIEFYSLESTVVDGSDFGDEFKDDTYSANVAMLYYQDGDKPYFYFLK